VAARDINLGQISQIQPQSTTNQHIVYERHSQVTNNEIEVARENSAYERQLSEKSRTNHYQRNSAHERLSQAATHKSAVFAQIISLGSGN
jgi:hypothetical protein